MQSKYRKFHRGNQKDHLVRVSSTNKKTFFNTTSPLPKTHFLGIVPMHQLKHIHHLLLNLFHKRGNRKLSTCWKTAVFPKKLENSDKRHKNIRIGIWFINRLSGGTISRKSSITGTNVNAWVGINQARGRGNV